MRGKIFWKVFIRCTSGAAFSPPSAFSMPFIRDTTPIEARFSFPPCGYTSNSNWQRPLASAKARHLCLSLGQARPRCADDRREAFRKFADSVGFVQQHGLPRNQLFSHADRGNA